MTQPESSSTYHTLHWKGAKWVLSPSFSIHILSQILREVEQPSSRVQTIKSNRQRTVFRIRLPQEERAFYMKVYHRVSLFQKVLSLLGLSISKGRKEWHIMGLLERRGFPSAPPLAFGEERKGGLLKKMHFLSREIPGEEVSSLLRSSPGLPVAPQLAQVVSSLHRLNFYHPDCHLENFLLDPSSGKVFLLDFHSARFVPFLPAFLRRKALTKLAHSLILNGWEDLTVSVLKEYYRLDPGVAFCSETLIRQIFQGVLKTEETRLKSRALRVLKKSSSFATGSIPQGKLFWNRQYSRDTLQSMMDQGLKEGPPGGEGPVFWQGQKLWMKRFPPSSRWNFFWNRSPGYRAWVGARALWLRGIPTPGAAAYLRSPKGEVLMVDHLEGAKTLGDRLKEGPLSLEVLSAIATLVFSLHNRGVHLLLSPENILVQGESVFLFPIEDLFLRPFQAREVDENLRYFRELLGPKEKVFWEEYHKCLAREEPFGSHPGVDHASL